MRIVNFQLLGLIILTSSLVSAVAYGVHGLQVRRNADVLLREAELAKERKDWNAAIEYLARYVILVPRDNAGPLADLGFLEADAGRGGEAYRTLENVLRQDASRIDVRRRLVELAISKKRYPDARYHLDILLKALPDDSELLYWLAQCQAGIAEYAAATETLALAIEKSPHHLDYAVRLAEILSSNLKDPTKALKVLDEMVGANVDDPFAYVDRGTYQLDRHTARFTWNTARSAPPNEEAANYSSNEPSPDDARAVDEGSTASESGDFAAALADARRALELARDDATVIAFAVRCFLANEKPEEADELVRRGLTLHPRYPFLYGLAAEVALMVRNRAEAIAWLRRGVDASSDARDLLYNLSNLLIDEGQYDEAEKYLTKLHRTDYPKPPIAFLEAVIIVKREEWYNASQRLERIRPSLAEWPLLAKQADFQMGQCFEQLGRNDLQLVAFRRATAVDSHWIPARMGVASALLSTGQLEQALEEYQQIAELPQAPTYVLQQLTRLFILLNFHRNPSEQNWELPTRLLDRLEELDREADAIPILRAEILLGQGEDNKAEATLLAARDRSPKTLEFWLGLASLAERRDDASRAAELLAEARSATGDSSALRLAQARHLVNQLGEEAKPSIRELAENCDEFSERDKTSLCSGLAVLTLAIADFEECERLCTAVADKEPTNLHIRRLLFDLAFREVSERARKSKGEPSEVDTTSMERVLDDVRRIEHSGPYWHYGEAIRLCILARAVKRPELYAKAKDHLTEARVARPTWSQVPLLVAQIAEIQGDEDATITNYLQAIDLGEQSPLIVSHTIRLLYQHNRLDAADRLIRRLQQRQTPFSSELTQLATRVSLQLNDNERALTLVKQAAASSKNPVDHVWAGEVLSWLGKSEDAEKSMRKAITLDESNAAAWVALIQHFGRTQQKQKADAALAEAELKIEPAEAPLALARALESIFRIDEAELQFKAAVEAAGDDDMPAIRRLVDFYLRHEKYREAEGFLQNIVNRKEGVTDEDRHWCRRSMALRLIAHGDQESLKKGLQLVEQNLAIQPASVDDQRAEGMILALFPDRDSMRKAAEIFERLLADPRAQTAESRFWLAQLYVKLNDLSKAAGHLRKLVAARGDEPRYLAYYAELLVSQKEFAEAELWIDRLVTLRPNEYATLALSTEVDFARERYDKLLVDVEKFLSNADPRNADNQVSKARLALLLEKFGDRLKKSKDVPVNTSQAQPWSSRFLQRADRLYREDAGDRPEDPLLLAAFLGRHGQHSEALDLLEKEWSSARPEKIVAVTSTLITVSGKATKSDYARAEQVLVKSLEKHGRPILLLLGYADLQNWSEKFDDAERLYREALEKDGTNPVALNNLALLLALRGGGNPESIMLIEKAVRIYGENPSLLDSRATINLVLGNPKNAAADLAEVIERKPSAAAYFRQAQAALRLGRRDSARESLARAAAMGLKVEELHPLERPVYQQLQVELQ